MSNNVGLIRALKRSARQGDRRALRELRERGFFGNAATAARRTYPPSHAQRRMWILDQIPGASSAFALLRAATIDGSLDGAALIRAFAGLIERHESLRTTFENIEGEPRQIVHAAMPFDIEMHDARGEAEPLERARLLARAMSTSPFDLATGPLLRVKLIRTSEAQHVLVLALHHIVGDAGSLDVIARELGVLYRTARGGSAPAMPPLAIQYKDFAAWQNERLQSADAAAHLAYWRQRLAPPLPVLDLPLDRPRLGGPAWQGRTITVDFGPAMRDGLAQLGLSCRVTLFATVLALVKVLLMRTSGQHELIVGVPVEGRGHPDLENQVGMYANAVALRGRVPPDLPFSAFLQKVKRRWDEAAEHQETPFDKIVAELGLDRDPSRSPVFDVLVGFIAGDRERLELDGLALGDFDLCSELAPHDLTLYFADNGRTLVLAANYRSDLIEEATIRRMIERLRRLAASAMADRAQPLGKLDAGPEDRAPNLPCRHEEIAARLIDAAGLVDAVVLPYQPDGASAALMAFCVPGDARPIDRLAQSVRAAAPTLSGSLPVMAISAMPLLPSGQPHRRALERCAGSAGGDTFDTGPRLLHLWDLVPSAAVPSASSDSADRARSAAAPAPAEKHPGLADGGIAVHEPEAPVSVPGILLAAAKRSTDTHIIFVGDDGRELRLSYAGLLERASRVLGGLRRHGYGPGGRAVLLLRENCDILTGFWACALGGLMPVIAPIPPDFAGPHRTVDQLAHLWELLERPLLLTDGGLSEPLRSLRRAFDIDTANVLAIEDLAEAEPAVAFHDPDPADTAFFTLTSGSTGVPKCVMLSHAAILARARGMNRLCGHSIDDVILNWLPFEHIGSLSDWHIRCVDLPCSLVYANKEAALGDPLNWLRLLARYRVTHSWAPNFAYALVDEALRASDHALEQIHIDLSCVKGLLTAGENVARAPLAAFLERLAPYGLTPAAIRAAFGMAEMGSGVTYALGTPEAPLRFHRLDRASFDGGLRAVAEGAAAVDIADLGPPIPGVRLRIIDDVGNPLPERRIGRLQVSGAALAAGYYRDPEATAAAFGAEGWFTTGDLGFLADGRLALTGRASENIVISGANYSCAEIETVAESVGGIEVSFTAAAAVRHPRDGEERLAVFFAAAEDEDNHLRAVLPEIRNAVASRIGILPDYLVPVSKEDVPKTAIGKIQRTRLVRGFADGEYDGAVRRADLLGAGGRTIPDWFACKRWRRCEARPLAPLAGNAVILADRLGVAAALVRLLAAEDVSTRLVADPDELSSGVPARLVVDLRGLDGAYADCPPEGSGLGGLLALTRRLVQRGESGREAPTRLLLATRGSLVVGNADPLIGDRPAWPGLIASLTEETPSLLAHLVDVAPDDPDAIAERCLAELARRGGAAISAWRGGIRYEPALTRIDLVDEPADATPFALGRAYLLAGGSGGVGRHIAATLAKTHGAKLLVISRAPVEQTAGALRPVGGPGQIMSCRADVADLSALHRAVDEAEFAFGTPLAGIVHLAGVAADRAILDETPDDIADVLRPKAEGSWALARMAEQRCPPGGAFIGFSSVSGFLGGARAAAYAAANSYLDATGDQLRARGRLRCWNLAWSMWDETGMSRGFVLKEAVRAKGLHILRPDAAVASFEAVLHRRPRYLAIGVDPDHARMRHRFAEPPRVLHDRIVGAEVAPVAPRSNIERRLAAIWSELLDRSEIGVHDHFIRLGGHSLKATQMVARIQRELGAAVALQDVFRAPTIAGLAELIRRGGKTAVPPIPVAAAAPDYPVSHAQHRLWVIEHLGIEQAAYNIPSASLIEGEIDVAALRQAIGQLVRRHEVLRTVFAEIDGTPRQIVRDRIDVPFDFQDLRVSSDPETAARREVDREAAHPFDLARGPLLRVVLLRLGDRRSVLLLNVHHIVSDAWSMEVMLRDLLAFYVAAREGAAAPLAELPLQYRDFAEWQQELLSGAKAREHRDYWLAQLGGELPLLELPADRHRPAVRSFRGGFVEFAVDRRVADDLQRLAAARSATMFAVWLALIRVLLYRYAGAAEAVIGTPATGREHPDLGQQVGFYVNMLPLSVAIGGELNFQDVLASVRSVVDGAIAHQAYPYDLLVEELSPRRDMGRNPLFDVVLSVQQREPQLSVPGIDVTPFPIEARSSKFDLTLFLGENTDGSWSAGFEYDSDLFDRERIEKLAAMFLALAGCAGRDPTAPIRDLEMLPAAERRLVLETFAAAPACYPSHRSIASVFEQQARRWPDRIAVETSSGRLSYRELNRRANGLALTLRAAGVAAEEPVGVLLDNSEWVALGFLGILKSGGAYLPLDGGYPAERIGYLLRDTGCRIVIGDRAAFRTHAARHPGTLFIDVAGAAEPVEESPLDIALGNSLAYIIYTSGTSGRPKGVMVDQRAVLRLVLNTNFVELGPETRMLMTGTVAFDASTFEIWGALLNGGTLVRAPIMALLEANGLKRLIEMHRITTMWLTASLFNQIVDTDITALAPLRELLIGGEKLSPRHVASVRRTYPDLVVINGYGPTENTTFTTCHRIGSVEDGDIPIGRPISNTTVYVLDRDLRAVPVGVPGEICAGGDGLARGYLNDDRLSAERFVPHPYRPDERLYRTGDLGRWRPDGALEILGRLDDQVKIRGYRVEPGEIDTRLREHPQVSDCCVVARPTDGGTRELIAYVAAKADLSLPALRAWLAERLPDYMLPARLVQLDSLPLNLVGKVDRAALPPPDQVADPAGAALARARNPAEVLLVSIWAPVLGRDEIGIHDNFFEIGGDSIRAIQIAGRMRSAGWLLRVRDIFEQPTIARLAPLLTPIEAKTTAAEPAAGPVPLTPTQRWFFATFRGNIRHFNQALLLRSARRLEPWLLGNVIRRVHRRHDALRLTFPGTDAALFADPEPRFEILDLRADADAAVTLAAALAAWHREFDLAHGPLWRSALIRLDDGDRLWFAAHHLVVDGVSWRILLEDIELGYGQAERAEPIELGPATASFARWAQELPRLADSPALREEADYWMGLSAPGPTPARDKYGEVQTIACRLSAEETRELLGPAHHAYGTRTDDFLLAALGRALAALADRDRIFVTLEGHGRDALPHELDLTRTIGWFTSIFPFELETTRGNLRAQIRCVKERLRQVPHKGAGYGLLRFMTDAFADAALPAPRISFNYLGQFDNAGAPALFAIADESAGPAIAADLSWPHDIDIVCSVSRGCMETAVSFVPDAAREAQRLLPAFAAELRAILAHCRGRPAEPTPADFAARVLTLDALDYILARHGWQAAEIEDVLPPTPMQRGLLVETLADRGKRAYVVQMAFTVAGPLDPDRFERAWCAVARRHWMLRAAMLHEGLPQPVLAILRNRRTEFCRTDLRGFDDPVQRQAIAEACRRDRDRGFDFEREALLRFAVFRLAEARWRIVWSYHHALLDGWSLGIVLRDFGNAYTGLAGGGETVLPPAPSPVKLARWLETRDEAAALALWREHLAACDSATFLPGAARPDDDERDDLAELVFELPAATTAGLRANATRAGATLSTISQAAWGVVLGRYNRSDEVVFGAVVSGRAPDLEGGEETVAALINAVPVRVRLRADDSIDQLVRRLQQDILTTESAQHLPLSEILAASPFGRELISHVVVVENYPLDAQVAAAPLGDELTIEDIEVRDRTHYDFALILVPGERLRLVHEFNPRIHRRSQIERSAAHLRAALTAFAGDPTRLIGDIDIRTAEEQEFMSAVSEGPAMAPVAPTSLAMIEAQIAATPHHLAIEADGNGITYRELGERVTGCADRLRRCGIGPGDRVAILARRCDDLPAALLAIWRLGAAYVPIDAEHPEARVRLMLEDCRCRVVIADQATAPHVAGWCKIARHRQLVLFARSPEPAPRQPDQAAGPGSGDSAYVLYTSGSTGQPKGAVIPHRALSNQIAWFIDAFGVAPGDRVLHKTALSFDSSATELFGPLAAGACAVLAKPDAHLDPDYLSRMVAERQITLIDLVPSQLAAINAVGGLPRGSALRDVLVGGEALDPALLAQLPADPGFRLHNLYGPTETCISATCWTWDGRRHGPVPIGRPVANTSICVLDAAMKPVPFGVPGEICIAGAQLATEYLGRPELTEKAFVTAAACGGERLYRTGDLGRWTENGQLEFLGRIDAQVKIRGHRIECGEVEEALRGHPSVADAVAIGCPAAGGDELVALIVAREDHPAPPELRSFLAARLPEPMLPTRFIALQRIPRLPNGKLDRRALLAAAAAPASAAPMPVAAPSDSRQAKLAAIWRRVLDRPVVAATDNFFEIGGHSLKALQILARMPRELGVRLTLREFFANPTIAAQAALLGPALSDAADRIEPAALQETYALSDAQARLWLLHQIPGGETAYNMPFAFTLSGQKLDPVALERAFAALCRRHEMLRTAFVVVEGEPRQRILPRVAVPLGRFDLRSRSPAEAETAARIAVEEEARRPFDLADPPLMRVILIEMPGPSPRYVLALTMHHIIGDGWSGLVLEREVRALYDAFRSGLPDPLPPLAIQYKDYSEWQNRKSFTEAEAWWLRQLADMPERLALNYDRPQEGQSHDFHGDIEEAVLDESATAGLRALARARGMTVAHALLALFQLVLYRVTGQDDIIVGMSVANRGLPETERLIGFFVNILPIRTRFSETMEFDEVLAQVARTAAEALDHQDYPFDLLVRRLCPTRLADRQPLVSVVYAFQSFEDVSIEVGGVTAAGDGEIAGFEFSFGTTKFDLTLFVEDRRDKLRLVLEYDRRLFDPATARRNLALVTRFTAALVDRVAMP